MFYYYGGKARLARYYAPPACPIIVEPFAGAAGYAMHHAEHVEEIILIESNPEIADLWERLLGMDPNDVLHYPIPPAGAMTSDRFVMMAAASNGVASCVKMTVTERQAVEALRMRKRVARLVATCAGKVTVVCGDYTSAPNIEATWFVDPPYYPYRCGKTGSPRGAGYATSALDYGALGAWCRTRRGQTIVCEQEPAEWLPFRSLVKQTNSQGRKRTEVVWESRPRWVQHTLWCDLGDDCSCKQAKRAA